MSRAPSSGCWAVQYLTVWRWCVSIAPRLAWARAAGCAIRRCELFEASRVALSLARISGRLIGVTVELVRYDLMDARDARGRSLLWSVVYEDVAAVQAQIRRDPLFLQAAQRGDGDRWPDYLAKALTSAHLNDRAALWRVLLVIRICAWRAAREERRGQVTLYVEPYPWIDAVARYAARHGILLLPSAARLDARQWLRRRLRPEMKAWIRGWGRASSANGPPPAGSSTKVAVDHYGHFNLKHPERHADLFFWQQSSLRGRDVALLFKLPKDPLDAEKRSQLQQEGIAPIVLHPNAAALPDAAVWAPRPGLRRSAAAARPTARGRETAWLASQREDYDTLRSYWIDLCGAHGIKLYVSWFKYDGSHAAIADALQSLGGATAIYQRSYESHAAAHTAVAADLFFGFSQATAEVERRSGSVIPYHVTTGYLGDHRFPLLRGQAAAQREALRRRGAIRILGFADEHSVADGRWYPSHEFMRGYYTFLLERVLEEPWLGLIVKPKVPATLRARLGPVAELLRRAEATGRCVIYEEGWLHGAYPPAAAALAADVMVHGHLHAATAGIESALAGVPTLLLDREGWPVSSLYRLGPGVVFTDWDALWHGCTEHWKRPEGLPGFGDWSSMLDEFDPFRDGRAAGRMGTYVQWLVEGFQAGLPRDTVLADAAERYVAAWGRAHVTSVNTGVRREAPGAVTAGAGR